MLRNNQSCANIPVSTEHLETLEFTSTLQGSYCNCAFITLYLHSAHDYIFIKFAKFETENSLGVLKLKTFNYSVRLQW